MEGGGGGGEGIKRIKEAAFPTLLTMILVDKDDDFFYCLLSSRLTWHSNGNYMVDRQAY